MKKLLDKFVHIFKFKKRKALNFLDALFKYIFYINIVKLFADASETSWHFNHIRRSKKFWSEFKSVEFFLKIGIEIICRVRVLPAKSFIVNIFSNEFCNV